MDETKNPMKTVEHTIQWLARGLRLAMCSFEGYDLNWLPFTLCNKIAILCYKLVASWWQWLWESLKLEKTSDSLVQRPSTTILSMKNGSWTTKTTQLLFSNACGPKISMVSRMVFLSSLWLAQATSWAHMNHLYLDCNWSKYSMHLIILSPIGILLTLTNDTF